MKSGSSRKVESRRMLAKVKVVCYHCERIVDKEKAFCISRFDAYLCPRCYLRLLEGIG
ncbi:MAG: hypothetical protein IBV52_02465 [Candidatus Bathyarchaeota archaeon]